MINKFVVEVTKTRKWLQLDFHDGSELIYVDKFRDALTFENEKQAGSFVIEHGLKLEDCRLFKIRMFVQPLNWCHTC